MDFSLVIGAQVYAPTIRLSYRSIRRAVRNRSKHAVDGRSGQHPPRWMRLPAPGRSPPSADSPATYAVTATHTEPSSPTEPHRKPRSKTVGPLRGFRIVNLRIRDKVAVRRPHRGPGSAHPCRDRVGKRRRQVDPAGLPHSRAAAAGRSLPTPRRSAQAEEAGQGKTHRTQKLAFARDADPLWVRLGSGGIEKIDGVMVLDIRDAVRSVCETGSG